MQISRLHLEGLPHSEISGSQPVSGSPKLIAACHVLHSLLAPRHPPYAFCSLTTKICFWQIRRFLIFRLSFSCILAYSVVKERSRVYAREIENLKLKIENFQSSIFDYFINGGAERDRTADPLLAKQVLSQLSYSPVYYFGLTIADCGVNIRNPESKIRN